MPRANTEVVPHRARLADEAILRKRIRELQGFRQLGLCSAADIEKYEADVVKRVSRLLSCLTQILIFLFPGTSQA